MKQLLFLLICIPLLNFSQESLEQELDSITTTEEAESFAKTYKRANKSKVFTFNKEKHKTRLAEDLFKLSKGGKQIIRTDFKKTYYKVIDKSDVTHHRASYIFFDGEKMTKEDIDEKREKIISQYKDGYKFDELAKLHSMDINAKKGGDLGWFTSGQMHPVFEEAIKEQDINDIFTVDIEDKNWYYVVLKTHNPKAIEQITVLKYTEDIE